MEIVEAFGVDEILNKETLKEPEIRRLNLEDNDIEETGKSRSN